MPNTISRTGIEGFDYCFNPVRGCPNNCEGKYGFECWARADTKQRAEVISKSEAKLYRGEDAEEIEGWIYNRLTSFKQTWLGSQFNKKFPKKPSKIIVGWQSDIAYWKPGWMERVLGKIREYPQHTFFFLTKKPEFFLDHYQEFSQPNIRRGLTITGKEDWRVGGSLCAWDFLSIEPLLEWPIAFPKMILPKIRQIIIGAQTGGGEKVTPKKEWVEAIIKQAKELSIPVYLKDNLLKAVPGLPRLKEIP
jgi:protein gp37